jgi:hypothetical protein
MAHGFGVVYYRNKKVAHVFTSPLITSTETLISIMVGNKAFEDAVQHVAIEGLGTKDALTLLNNEQFRDLVAGDVSTLEAVVIAHDLDIREVFVDEAMVAIKEMFACMADGELGVGVFEDPFISMAAEVCGLEDARSLEPLEHIVFKMDDGGDIVAFWPLIHE